MNRMLSRQSEVHLHHSRFDWCAVSVVVAASSHAAVVQLHCQRSEVSVVVMLHQSCCTGMLHHSKSAVLVQEACPNAPWSLTFSYGRALQSATLKVCTDPACYARQECQMSDVGCEICMLSLLSSVLTARCRNDRVPLCTLGGRAC